MMSHAVTASSTVPHPYARSGFVGVMVPYGNFATEWETAVVMPNDYFALTTRLQENGDSLQSRLREYFNPLRLGSALSSFGSTPLHAVGVACSATSYLIGHQKEREIFEQLAQRYDQRFTWSTQALRSALSDMGEKRFTLVSPYSPDITEACVAYWRQSGYVVDGVEQLSNATPGFHSIYTIPPADVLARLSSLADRARSPLLVTGTGLSTLPAVRHVLRRQSGSAVPILSANLALVRDLLRLAGDADTTPQAWFSNQATWIASSSTHPRMQEFIHA